MLELISPFLPCCNTRRHLAHQFITTCLFPSSIWLRESENRRTYEAWTVSQHSLVHTTSVFGSSRCHPTLGSPTRRQGRSRTYSCGFFDHDDFRSQSATVGTQVSLLLGVGHCPYCGILNQSHADDVRQTQPRVPASLLRAPFHSRFGLNCMFQSPSEDADGSLPHSVQRLLRLVALSHPRMRVSRYTSAALLLRAQVRGLAGGFQLVVMSGCKCLHVAASLTEVGLMLASLHDRVALLSTSCLLGAAKWIFAEIVQILDDEGFLLLGRVDIIKVYRRPRRFTDGGGLEKTRSVSAPGTWFIFWGQFFHLV